MHSPFVRRRFAMCGRYHIDNETMLEIEKLVRQIDDQPGERAFFQEAVSGKDIFPGSLAPVITAAPAGLKISVKKWGFPGFQKNQLIFNARAESAAEKKMFQDSIRARRCVIPASCFYEWNSQKEKFTFKSKKESVLYMAGFYKQFEDGDCFVILTTKANASMEPVHDRMPLLLKQTELQPFIWEEMQVDGFLRKVPEALKRQTDYEQQSLSFSV